MAATDPTLTISINDVNSEVKGYTYTDTEFTFVNKAQTTLNIIDTDGFVPVTCDGVTTIERLVIRCSDSTSNNVLRINHDPGGGAVDKDIPFADYLVLKVTAAFAAEILLGAGLSLSTDVSLQDVKFNIDVFGS